MSAKLILFSEPCPECGGKGALAQPQYLADGTHVSTVVRACGMCHGRRILKTLAAYEAERKRAEAAAKAKP